MRNSIHISLRNPDFEEFCHSSVNSSHTWAVVQSIFLTIQLHHVKVSAKSNKTRIIIFVVTLIHRITQQRKRWSSIATKTHKHHILGHFGKKKKNSIIGHCRNVRGLGKSLVVFRLFEKLRCSNERSKKDLRVFTTNRSIWRRKITKW